MKDSMNTKNFPKVSILMNCYNGERYLHECIESVFHQSFDDWEIVFIDNCSTDNSGEIARSYEPKLKYFKTNYNISLGEARAFGIDKCNGEYLMYLDVDDRYHKNTINILLNEIIGTNNLIVYAGHRNINHFGDVIGKYKPKPKSGKIFSDLLSQFDIPTASLIMNLSKYKEFGYKYDKEVKVSSEYNLFMKLSVLNNFKCIRGEIVDYRIHADATTFQNQEYASRDRIFTLEKIISEHPDIVLKFPLQFKEAFARADYYKARTHIEKNELVLARKIMRKHIFLSLKYMFVYSILFFPETIRKYIFTKKYNI